MRMYLSCNEAVVDIARELKKCSSEVHTQTYQNKVIELDPRFATKELQAFEFCIINTDDKDQMPNVTVEWAKKEFQERTSLRKINPGQAYKLRREVWDEFLVKGKFDYTYNERIAYQLQYVVTELEKHPETRQAIIEIHYPNDARAMGRKRIPCSMFYQFMKRDGALDIIYVMRSSDFSTHFQNDVWLADEMRRHIAKLVGLPIGKFIMFVSSLHIYKKNWEELANY